MLKNKCCLYVIISIRFFSITICNLLIEFPSYHRHYRLNPAQTNVVKNTICVQGHQEQIAGNGRKYFFTVTCSRDFGFTRPALSCVELSASEKSAFESKPTTFPNTENMLNLTCVSSARTRGMVFKQWATELSLHFECFVDKHITAN